MDDKFIISSLNDDKSREIAEILANKTARKILDFLSEHESSETDIAKSLNLPISTVHYNMQKLLKTRIVEIKDHFWSEKGNRINIYSVARKMIVIAPKYARGYNVLKSIIPVIIVAIFAITLITLMYNPKMPPLPGLQNSAEEISDLKKFSSLGELRDFVRKNAEFKYFGLYYARELTTATGTTASESEPQKATEFSTTNIQVEGVDEADIVKNDGKYIYTLSGNSIVIVDAYPTENAKIVSRINFTGTASEIFINNNKLVVFGFEQESYAYIAGSEEIKTAEATQSMIPPIYSSPTTFMEIYNVEDRANPVLERNLSFRGSYYDSRMIGNYVYAVVNLPVINYNNIIMPAYAETGLIREAKATDIYYFDIPDASYNFVTVAAINLQDEEEISTKVFMMGNTQNMYVSTDNIYVTYQKILDAKHYNEKLIADVYLVVAPDEIADEILKVKESNETYSNKVGKIGNILQGYIETLDTENRYKLQTKFEEKMQGFNEEIEKERQKTVIHRISVNKNNIEHEAEGEVPGNVLNQFSMDEYNNHLRIATTTSGRWGDKQSNNVYVLNMDLEITGKIEGLAEGEKIYSARFLQDRAYLVTFKKIDPLFVINLENPESPEVLGYLKIPGYSDYLHPYDENHLIGIGKETAEAESGNFAWYQGVKISLFDVSNVSNPVEIDKYEVGDRGTDSYALHEHKAFLFSKSKNLLVLPILLAEIDKSQYSGEISAWAYGRYVWQGAYVFSISAEDGIKVKGRITHEDNKTADSSRYYYWNSNFAVKRSLYMENTLYTISDSMIKANNLEYLEEINKVQIS